MDLWGGNTSEVDRIPNRRVRILLDDNILTPADLRTVCTWEEIPGAGNPVDVIHRKTVIRDAGSNFPWWIIPLALMVIAMIAAIILFAFWCRRSFSAIPAAASAAIVPVVPTSQKIYVLEEEEIRRYAYELYQQRNGWNEDAVEDWHWSVRELTAYYEDLGFRVILYWEVEKLSA